MLYKVYQFYKSSCLIFLSFGGNLYVTMDYYSIIICLVLVMMVVLTILTIENDRFTKEEKRTFHIAHVLVGLAAIMEWLGLLFDGNTDIPAELIKTVKFFDYVLTPITGVAIVWQMSKKSVIKDIIILLLGLNFILQMVCFPMGWMVKVDEANHYSHGVLYPAYIVIYSLVIALVLVEFVKYGIKFRKHNRVSLYAIIALIAGGIIAQEVSGGVYRTAYLVVAIGMVFLFIHYSEFFQQKMDETLEENKNDLVLSQIKPYFINSCLSSISELCKTDPKAAQKLTDDFSEYLKNQLDSLSNERMIPFGRALEQVEVYLKIEETRFGDRIKVIFDIQADKFLVPTLTIQPLVENAIRHGICKKKEGGTVFVKSYEREKEYVIEIIDDGVGFDKKDVFGKAKKHFGIDNVKTRLEYCGGKLEINSEKNFGTTVTIRMPKNIRI